MLGLAMLLPKLVLHLLAHCQQFVLVVVQVVTEFDAGEHADESQTVEVVFVVLYDLVCNRGQLAHGGQLQSMMVLSNIQPPQLSRKNILNVVYIFIYNRMQDSSDKLPHTHSYQRVRLLGSGSFGKAYLVREAQTGNLYAIKQISIAQLTEEERLNTCKQAKILEMLDHPNIIKFKDIFTTDKGKLNIVMEYADDGDLSLKISQAKTEAKLIDEAEILNLFTQICLGLKHLHDRKIIHRDLKSQNIFLTQSGCVKIGDMGVARVLEHTVAKVKTVVGTPYYLSPEIIDNKPYSFKSDIWSLGALLYQMCALSPPFTANNLQFLALKIVRGAYPNIPPQYSQDLRNLIKSMLNTNSNLRPNINQILSSPIINRRIKSLLTESQNMKQFSHTVLHKFNVLKNEVEDKLRPPPNLIEIQQENENLSAIEMERKMLEQPSCQAKAKTPSWCGKNPPPIKKKPLLHDKKTRPNTANNLQQIMKIKATPLQQHLPPSKFPKVSPNPLKKRPETPKQSPEAIEKKQMTSIIFNKKKSIDCVNFKKEHQPQLKPKQEQKVIQLKKIVKEEQIQPTTQQAENVSQNCLNKKNLDQVKKIKLQIKNEPMPTKQKKETKPANKITAKPKQARPKHQQGQKKDTKFQLVSEELKNKQKQKEVIKKNVKKGVVRKSKSKLRKVQQKPKSDPSMQVTRNDHVHDEETAEQEKCNDPSDDKYDTEEFEAYEPGSGEDSDFDLSFQLSNSSFPSDLQTKNKEKQKEGGNKNYQKMLAELQIINKIVETAKGKVENLPMLGSSIPELLQLSNSVRQNQSDFSSEQGCRNGSQQMTAENLSQKINLACFNNQCELENLRITLEQIFGIENIIKAYKYLSEIINEKELEFDEEEVIRNLLKTCPEIEECLLRRHFRLIVTVIGLQLQICTDTAQF